jgi:hypothetical protein
MLLVRIAHLCRPRCKRRVFFFLLTPLWRPLSFVGRGYESTQNPTPVTQSRPSLSVSVVAALDFEYDEAGQLLPGLYDDIFDPSCDQLAEPMVQQQYVPGADPSTEPTLDTPQPLPQPQSVEVLEVEPALGQYVEHDFAGKLGSRSICLCGNSYSRRDALTRHIKGTAVSIGSFVEALPASLPALSPDSPEMIWPTAQVSTGFSSIVTYHQDDQDHQVPTVPQIFQSPQSSNSSHPSPSSTGPTSGRIRSGRRFTCQFCDKYRGNRSFTRRDHLRQHLQRGHKFNDASVKAYLKIF